MLCKYKSADTLTDVDAGKAVHLKAQRKLSMSLPYYHTAGKNHSIKEPYKSSENVLEFRYLGMMLTNQNYIHEETESRSNSENTLYHPIQYLLSFHDLSKNVKIKIMQICSCISFCMGEELGLILRKEHRFRMYEYVPEKNIWT
jgi:hypothetical protein